MALETAYYSASGPSFSDCYFLAQRCDADAGYKPLEAECWGCGVEPSGDAAAPHDLTRHRASTGWFTDPWRSPSGSVHVSSADGEIHLNPALSPTAAPNSWNVTKIRDALFGIRGLDVRQDLIIGMQDAIVGSSDGIAFAGVGRSWLLDSLAGKPLCYFA